MVPLLVINKSKVFSNLFGSITCWLKAWSSFNGLCAPNTDFSVVVEQKFYGISCSKPIDEFRIGSQILLSFIKPKIHALS